MANKDYSVVDFPLEETVEAVPSSWLTENRKECYYPGVPNVAAFIKRHEPPSETWLKFSCIELRSGSKK